MSTAAPIKKIPLTSSDIVIAQMQAAIFDTPLEFNSFYEITLMDRIIGIDPLYSGKPYNAKNLAQDIAHYFMFLNKANLLVYKADTTLNQTIIKPWVIIENIYNNKKTTIDCKSLTTFYVYIYVNMSKIYDIENNGYSIDLFYYKTKNHVGTVPLHVACTVYSNDPNNEQGYLCDMAKLLLLLQNGHMTLAQPVKVVKYCNHKMGNIPFGAMAKVTVKNPL